MNILAMIFGAIFCVYFVCTFTVEVDVLLRKFNILHKELNKQFHSLKSRSIL